MSEQLHHLSIDLETYSEVNIGKAGAYRYILDPSFEILLFAYSLDGMPVERIDVASGQVIPLWLKSAIKNPLYIKHAYNAAFEWFALSKYLGLLPPDQWRDTMLHALYCGYPASLDAAGKAMGLPEDKKKLATGKALIRYFCVPCKPSNANGNRTRNLPQHDPAKWALFKEYNGQDVVTEMEIERRLSAFPVPAFVQKQWETDLLMNARGVAADMEMVSGALVIGATVKSQLMAEARQLSGLDNPNSIKQLAQWLTDATDSDAEITSVTKETVATMLKQPQPANVQRMLEIRQELGKTSTKKYDALETCIADDGRVRGLLQFYGANRTGRWAGRLVQVQNLPRTYTHPLPPARQLVKDRNIAGLRMIYGSINDTLSQLIRTAFVATPGNVLIDADFSAIEARVISWLAGQEWRLEVFRTHGKIYEASASQMFHVPIEKIKKGNPEYALRQRGKVAELALGYQGGVSAMRRMDTGHNLDDLSDDEVKGIVDRWRETNSMIRDLWNIVDSAAVTVITNGGAQTIRSKTTDAVITLACELDVITGTRYMTILLPSGRKLYYPSPEIGVNRWGNPSVSYMGQNQTTKRWERVETYGGKLVENIVQAIARDCLAIAIENLEAQGLHVVFHIHDEVVIDTPAWADNDTMLDTVTKIMTKPIPWAQALPLNADGWVDKFFKKD
ncbi:MAG: DNA polymerase [Gemmiger formicilis]|uniref:DNA polymerase n=1 Tax=Gemmiger formicilis TaxID=745368 RepID=UPI002E79B762|nr:DNA polymerase [Gemmiger formicilis]MEE1512406.1 DNA polymerase [Gemmiger formicilis]